MIKKYMKVDTINDFLTAGTAAAGTQVATGQDPTNSILPVIIGLLAPIIRDVLYRAIDRAAQIIREKRQRRINKK